MLALTITRSPALKPTCKDLGRNDQRTVITPKAAYTPVSPALARAHDNALAVAETCT
ncbi:alpha-galactosidase [Lacticaseibacillus paracasei]|uniref:Alpha-galactosidase n=1 Tax=Lacticaseibacillus paracasei TaxID=1597 RepID=A0ABD7BXD8_LACPA|nr:alpha-galactosidase [Lacticaseibacillus paracasei]PTS55221.1 alpha-galactosidase [Lactobacillus sp. DS22_6]QOP56959.1 alpha-galactosidase [Lacticaseibacillus paracasei]RDV41254.1 alpha-galactosidase [Lacticaseibacillus paracasei subsp. paracasei]RYS97568.1 alpha-galactosidase [Lacticaseibacillus paracasei]